MSERYVHASNVSEGWLEALRVGRECAGRGVHLVIRIDSPDAEDPEIRARADWLQAEREHARGDKYKPVDTVRNTIFPEAWARRFPDPQHLAAYYRKRYGDLRQHAENRHGTYFGRLVAYPRGPRRDWSDVRDQLNETIRKLREEHGPGGTHRSSRYELNIFNERWDTLTMGFPCLSFVSLHAEEGRLHLQATYRNETLVARGYGNYLGLGQLLAYIAGSVQLDVGEMLVQAGHFELDAPIRSVAHVLQPR